MSKPTRIAAIFILAFTLTGCRGEIPEMKQAGKTMFTLLPAGQTGVDFNNRLNDTEAFNVFTYRNYYNGGGVGIADINGDGLADIFLTANQLRNRLYINRGGFRFDDVTGKAGVAGSREWSTGATIADVNGDGLLDIYVSNAGNARGTESANELFINQGIDGDGIPRFEEMAEAFGLADEGYSTHASFFDYDQDGDLDVYVLNNSSRPVDSFGLRNTRRIRDEHGGDKLFRNDGGVFHDVSASAGIYGSEIGFGLGVSAGDINRDGLIDLYISNDFFERDYLYINNGDGTFDEQLEDWMPHISLSSMGADIADINNDGYPEIYVTDMLPESDRRLKTTSSFESWSVYRSKMRNDYYFQYMRNMLHFNNTDGTFSEIGQFAGVSKTDWSWGALLFDIDLDGSRDLYVTNGIYRDVTDRDFIDYFSSGETIKRWSEGRDLTYIRLLEQIPSQPIPNFAFRNRGDRTFEDVSDTWGLSTSGFSNGVAYGDLDNDGDLDLVVNNVNMDAFVYRSEARQKTAHNFVQVSLEGENGNRFGIGASVTLHVGDERMYAEQIPARGFQSSVDYVLAFGLGTRNHVDSLSVEWPNMQVEVRRDVPINTRLTLRQTDAKLPAPRTSDSIRPASLFRDITDDVDIEFVHRENDFVDFNRERLIPRMMSTEGPSVSVADVNADGLDDFYIGGAKDSPGRLHVQQPGGSFITQSDAAFDADAISEDVASEFFDADGDGDQDLYVGSGGTEWSERAPGLRDRLYINDGRGNYRNAVDQLPRLFESTSSVHSNDFDGDGDMDLFVGSRLIPWKYGLSPESHLLENIGSGTYADITDRIAPALDTLGMVTDAVWVDYDTDGDDDLIVVGDWMNITVLKNSSGAFEPVDVGLTGTNGWWTRIEAGDLDGDGDIDLVVGNFGSNNRFNVTQETPLSMYVNDFDRNGWVEQIVSFYKGERSYPMSLLDELSGRLNFLKQKYTTYESFAEQSIEDIFTTDQLTGSLIRTASTLRSAIVVNEGNGRLILKALPPEVQLAPVFGLLIDDFDANGTADVLVGGNFFGFTPQFGRMDASYGLLLKGTGHGSFLPVPAHQSGFFVSGEVRDLAIMSRAGKPVVVVARNNDRPLFFSVGLER
jgi:enediyne biosynthesis protein E4